MVGVAAIGAPLIAAVPRKFGLLTIRSHRAHKQQTGENLRVFVDGREVRRCIEADDIEGYAIAFCTDQQEHRDWSKQGHVHLATPGNACKMRITGNVTIRV